MGRSVYSHTAAQYAGEQTTADVDVQKVTEGEVTHLDKEWHRNTGIENTIMSCVIFLLLTCMEYKHIYECWDHLWVQGDGYKAYTCAGNDKRS